MQVKNFEELEIWKEARLLTTKFTIYPKLQGFRKTLAYEIKCNVQQSRLCQISLKDLSAVEIKNLFNFSTSPKRRAERCGLNFTWRWIKNTSIRR